MNQMSAKSDTKTEQKRVTGEAILFKDNKYNKTFSHMLLVKKREDTEPPVS